MTRSRNIGLAFAIFLAAAGSIAEAQTTHSLTVRRHSGVAISNGTVDGFLTDATSVLKDDEDGNGTADIPCDVTFSRSGNVQKFGSANTPKIITTESHLNTVHAEASFVKVVEEIKFCDKAYNSTLAGCAQSGSMIVIHHANAKSRHLVWAHEFGHTAGLPHRGGNNDLMTDLPLASTQTRTNQNECDAFLGASAIAAVNGAGSLAKGEESDPATADLLDIVSGSFVDRVPYQLISAQSASDLESIVPLLQDLGAQDIWPNILTAMGILGGDTDRDALIDFVDTNLPGANVSATFRAKSAALIALGYYLNRIDDRGALGYLLTKSAPEAWDKAGPWLGQTGKERQERGVALQQSAMIGLALSGHPIAAAMLQPMAMQLAVDTDEERQGFIAQLAETHSRVAQRGLEEYYRKE